MAALYWLIPAAVLIVGVALYLLCWSLNSGQYDDLDSPASRILFDDDDPAHQAAAHEGREHDQR